MNEKFNPDKGSDFDGLLKREGIYEEVMASPKVKKAITANGKLPTDATLYSSADPACSAADINASTGSVAVTR